MSESDRQRVLREAKAFGVDLSILRERLRLTPDERLRLHAKARQRVAALRAAALVLNRASSLAST